MSGLDFYVSAVAEEFANLETKQWHGAGHWKETFSGKKIYQITCNILDLEM